MPKMRQKSELPSKLCETCGRSFVWRKKWRRDWEYVRYCSDRCRRRVGGREQKKAGIACDPVGSQANPVLQAGRQ